MTPKKSEEQIFVFPREVKAASIDLSLLAQSSMIRSAGSNNPGNTRPLQSWELIQNIQEMIDKAGHTFEQKDIWVQERSSTRILTNQEMQVYKPDNTPIERWMFDHVLTKIDLAPAFHDNGKSPAIAVSFTKQGIKVAFGMNVHVCSNLCIYGDNYISTYGNNRMPFAKQMDILQFWINMVEEKFQDDLRTTATMQMHEVDGVWVRETVGDLYMKAIAKAYPKTASKDLVSPVNTGQLSVMIQKMNVEDVKSVWDFYNAGTAIIKENNMFLEDVLDVNIAWGKYLAEKVAV
jgi:hypothetical protein